MAARERRLFAPQLEGDTLRLDDSEAHYARDVLRLSLEDEVLVFDGKGRQRRARVDRLSRKECVLELHEAALAPRPATALTVFAALPKGERADSMVEKLSELGVFELRFTVFSRSVVKDPSATRIERWRRLALAAARQCGRADLMSLDGPEPFTAALAHESDVRLVADPSSSTPLAKTTMGPTATLVIGPEGGLSSEELAQLRSAGYTDVSLSTLTLRVETAAAAAAAIALGQEA